MVIIVGLLVNRRLAMEIEKEFEKELWCDECHLQTDCKVMGCNIEVMHCLDHHKEVR